MIYLHIVAVISVSCGLLCSIIILADIFAGNKQHMMIMNFVWPITGLYAGPLALIAYYTIGKKSTHKKMTQMKQKNMQMPEKPFWQSVGIGALHCGSGCTLGDIIAEILLLNISVVIVSDKIINSWLIDYFFAFVLGIVFQYYSIKPMKNLTPKQKLIAALKADTLSLTAWQVGMYGGMAIADFLIFKYRLQANTIVFWFIMQLAMLLGFLTSYPVNWWLLKKGIKEVM
ncbi:MAG TPA: DUF4396 domain-containing protein [Parafilimonas sp.]|jgi:hypothetical protein